MTEYIERETAIKMLHYNADESCSSVVADFEALPAADVEPVVHGRWIEHIDDYENYCECSICHYTPDAPLDETPRCPNCGAKMEEAR